jgi:hypothetical protein
VLNRSTYNRMIEERDRRSGPWVSTMDPRAKLNIVGQGLTTTIHHRGRPLAALGPRT